MSNFNQLKSMWENKGKNQVKNPTPQLIKPAPEKLKPSVQSQQQVKPKSDTQNRQSKQTVGSVVSQDSSKKSITQLKKSLENNLKLNVPNPRFTQQYQVIKDSSMVQKSQEQILAEEPKRNPKDIHPIKGSERMPTFMESKANLQRVFEKKKNENEGYYTGPPVVNKEGLIDLKKQDADPEKLTAEQRTEQVIKLLFSNSEAESPTMFLPMPVPKHSESAGERKTFLNKEEQATSLNLRNAKKEKKNLGGFDDA